MCDMSRYQGYQDPLRSHRNKVRQIAERWWGMVVFGQSGHDALETTLEVFLNKFKIGGWFNIVF